MFNYITSFILSLIIFPLAVLLILIILTMIIVQIAICFAKKEIYQWLNEKLDNFNFSDILYMNFD